MKKYIAIALCAALFTAAGCAPRAGDAQQGQAQPGGAPSWAPDPDAEAPPSKPPWEREAQDKSKTITQLRENTIQATITMEDGGVIVVDLYPDVAPQSVRNFVHLARLGFYDGLKFHRIMSGFMIQGGCPDATGSGNPGYSIWGEFKSNGFTNDLKHNRGVLSMARGGDPYYNSGGSQFFIVHQASSHLDGDYAAFGRVTSGLDVVDKIAKTPTSGSNGRVAPENMPVIKSIVIDDDIELPEPEKLPR